MKRKQYEGFTLIELLVVIAIIAILAAILFPVFARARENARKSTCQSNLKQISVAIQQYTQDYDEKYPYAAWNSGVTLGLHWLDSTMPYLKNEAVWKCPSASASVYAANGSFPVWNGTNGDGPNLKAAYSWNENAMNQSLSVCSHPADTFLIMDRGNSVTFTGWYDWKGRGQNTVTGSGSVPGPHMDGKNVAFVDGHVKWIRSDAMKAKDTTTASGVDPDPSSPYYSYFSN